MEQSVACIIAEKGCVFIARRLPVGEMGGRWEFPGGKVEQGEDPVGAVHREFREEFASSVTVGALLGTAEFEHRGIRRQLLAYAVFLTGKPADFILAEHSEWDWVTPSEITRRSFVDSDLLLLDTVIAYAKKT
jgi:8-oxo-dGTP diphosphatase